MSVGALLMGCLQLRHVACPTRKTTDGHVVGAGRDVAGSGRGVGSGHGSGSGAASTRGTAIALGIMLARGTAMDVGVTSARGVTAVWVGEDRACDSSVEALDGGDTCPTAGAATSEDSGRVAVARVYAVGGTPRVTAKVVVGHRGGIEPCLCADDTSGQDSGPQCGGTDGAGVQYGDGDYRWETTVSWSETARGDCCVHGGEVTGGGLDVTAIKVLTVRDGGTGGSADGTWEGGGTAGTATLKTCGGEVELG